MLQGQQVKLSTEFVIFGNIIIDCTVLCRLNWTTGEYFTTDLLLSVILIRVITCIIHKVSQPQVPPLNASTQPQPVPEAFSLSGIHQ